MTWWCMEHETRSDNHDFACAKCEFRQWTRFYRAGRSTGRWQGALTVLVMDSLIVWLLWTL